MSDENYQGFIDAATGVFHQRDTSAPCIPLCEMYAEKMTTGGGLGVSFNPGLLEDPRMLRAFIDDARIILSRIEAAYLKGKKGGAK